jgi:hypothetical protein
VGREHEHGGERYEGELDDLMRTLEVLRTAVARAGVDCAGLVETLEQAANSREIVAVRDAIATWNALPAAERRRIEGRDRR